MTQRVMVYIICRLVEVAGQGTGAIVDDWWVDCTVNGSADIAAIKAARNGAVNGTKTSVVQYHVYYADGGHAKFKESYYLAEEKALWPSNPTLRPDPLVPTPELMPA
ncbi:hypothetical protein phiPsa347_021 [Pseudomonas phage phiPsa347]|uniref:Uncharacterized protein n=1 Tax=Pseudomonas phage phiPsa347 TaxID=1460364 RepID=A0A7G9V2G7_9CAUD|nr:hypothetical protein QGX18_gp021 [Pseudomonas phage phiPsa347]QNO00473.1 hypothetical protein phiPsa347_021 [Pseudomonas phage phiPsa347]